MIQMNKETKKKDSKEPIFKGTLPEDRDEIARYFRIESVEDLAAMLGQLPEEDNWELIRQLLLAIRVNIVHRIGEKTPYSRAIAYLYTLGRWIETYKRFPSHKEQGEILEDTASNKDREELVPKDMATYLKEAGSTPKSRKADRQLQERGRKYRGGGIELQDSPDINGEDW
jgi:hypothetical protein